VRQLSGIDAAFLQMETPTTYAHVAVVAVFAPAPGQGPLTLGELRERLAARIHRAPVLRQRLLTVPWELDRPYWVDDAGFGTSRASSHDRWTGRGRCGSSTCCTAWRTVASHSSGWCTTLPPTE